MMVGNRRLIKTGDSYAFVVEAETGTSCARSKAVSVGDVLYVGE